MFYQVTDEFNRAYVLCEGCPCPGDSSFPHTLHLRAEHPLDGNTLRLFCPVCDSIFLVQATVSDYQAMRALIIDQVSRYPGIGAPHLILECHRLFDTEDKFLRLRGRDADLRTELSSLIEEKVLSVLKYQLEGRPPPEDDRLLFLHGTRLSVGL